MRKQPHIIIFNPDEMRWDTMGHMGNPAAVTPFLDEFSEKGNCYLFPCLLSEYGLRSQPMQLFYRTVPSCPWPQNHELSSSSRREQSVFRTAAGRILCVDECQKRFVCRTDRGLGRK